MGRFNHTEITVVNRTSLTLQNVDAGGHTQGGFESSPASPIGSGRQFTFRSVQLPGEADGGGDIGSVVYDIGGTGRTFWTINWANRETGPSQVESRLDGEDTEFFDTNEEMPEEGGDVSATFTLTEAAHLTLNDYVASMPVEGDEPTLRFGDESVDGWVEYLQRLLTVNGLPVEQNGRFDNATHAAVISFQQRMNAQPATPSTGRVLVDGIVGNQTWALLREEDARPPSTDGREPHSFVESGREARWLTEDSAFVFLESEDRLVIQGVSTGDTPIESGALNARIMIVLPNTETIVRDLPIFTANGAPAGQGSLVFVEFDGAADRSREVENPSGTRGFMFQAFMPAELGGDVTQSLSVPFA